MEVKLLSAVGDRQLQLPSVGCGRSVLYSRRPQLRDGGCDEAAPRGVPTGRLRHQRRHSRHQDVLHYRKASSTYSPTPATSPPSSATAHSSAVNNIPDTIRGGSRQFFRGRGWLASGIARIFRQKWHGVCVHEIRQKAHKFLPNLSERESVAGTEKCVVFTTSLPLPNGVIRKQKLPNWCMCKFQGHVPQYAP